MTNKEAIKYLQQLYPNSGHCWLDEQRIEAIGMAIKALQEELSENLEEAANFYADTHTEWFDADNNPHVSPAFKAGVKWYKEQMMSKAIDVEVKVDAGGYPYIPQMELYDYDKDVPLAKAGDRYKVVLIKEE